MIGSGFIRLLIVVYIIPSALSLTTPKIQVCQNKNCVRNFGSTTSSYFYTLPQILQDLSPLIEVESTGCLSKCDKGPNMQLTSSSVVLHGVKDHIQAAAALDELGLQVSVQNMAAIAVLEKADQASSAAEKEIAFNSVIRTLEPQGGSSVLARALIMRAEFRNNSGGKYEETIVDTKEALLMPMSIQVSRRAWRLLADAHTATGQVDEALECLQDWMKKDPSFQSKISLEMEVLQRNL